MPKVTQAVQLIRYTPNSEEAVALAAKLCYSPCGIDDLTKKVEDSDCAKFIDKLLDMGHLSPIEHVSFTFSIEGVSRSLLAQITRHRIASFSVRSQRYVSEGEGFNYIIPPEIELLGNDAVKEFEDQMEQIQQWYIKWQQRLGGNNEKSNEDARFVLPNASETKMILTMNARELMHFFSLRCCQRAQWEIRELAWNMLKLVSGVAPNLFKKAGPDCIDAKCPEGQKTCGKRALVLKRKEELNK